MRLVLDTCVIVSAASQPIALSEKLLEQAAQQANRLGVTTGQWIETALAEKIRLERKPPTSFKFARPEPQAAN